MIDFNKIKFEDSWKITNKRTLSTLELNSIVSAHIKQMTYGKGVCFLLRSGEEKCISLSSNSALNDLSVGDTVCPNSLLIATLEKYSEVVICIL